MSNIDNKIEAKPDIAFAVLSELGFGLVPWLKIAKQFGKESSEKRTYGITFKIGDYTYILGKLYCGTPAEVSHPYIGSHVARGFFFDLDEGQAASDLGIWAEDPGKRFTDEKRYAIISGIPHENDIHYHVKSRFDAEKVYQRLWSATGPLLVAGFKNVEQQADIKTQWFDYFPEKCR